jgi:hypothetical protein
MNERQKIIEKIVPIVFIMVVVLGVTQYILSQFGYSLTDE